jgi:hypothetical protein
MHRSTRTIAAAAALSVACASWHQSPGPAEAIARAKSGEIRVYRVDGALVRLVNASIVGDSLIGVSPVTGARVAMPTTAVVSTQTKEFSAGRTALLGGGVVVGVIAVAGILAVVLFLSAGWN